MAFDQAPSRVTARDAGGRVAEHAGAAAASAAAAPSLRQRLRQLLAQVLKFGLVGGVGFLVDTGIYNLLVLTVLSDERFLGAPLVAKAIATVVAIATNWLGNRLWTFRQHRRHDSTREGVEFFAVSLVGLVIGALPLGVSHYLLGWDSLFADNIANLVGLGLGSVFRFALYRWWVFAPSRRRPPAAS